MLPSFISMELGTKVLPVLVNMEQKSFQALCLNAFSSCEMHKDKSESERHGFKKKNVFSRHSIKTVS